MKFLLLLAGWSTLTFICAWFMAPPYHAMFGILERMVVSLVVPPGSRWHYVRFYPYDVGLYVALCLASTWVPVARRVKAIAIGFPVIVVLELLSVAVMIQIWLTATSQTSPELAVEAERFVHGVARVSQVIAPAGVWFLLLGRRRLSLVARTWYGT